MKFDVNKVKPASAPLKEIPTKKQIESLIQRPVEACSNMAEPVVTQEYHGLINTAKQAFQRHHPLALSPDDIWLTIAQGFAQHINNNEEMRHNFVKHDGKEKIIVRRDGFMRGSPENDWESIFDEFGHKIHSFIGETYYLIRSDFSTTGPTEKAASEVVLMDAMKSYFDYEVHTLCGIPSVELLGTVEDWEKLRDKVTQLQPFIPDWWYSKLDKIAYEFVEASKGNVDDEWWSCIYNLFGGSGGNTISGWLVTLIPYVRPNVYPKVYEYTEKNPAEADGQCWRCDVRANRLPSSLCKTPFIWQYYQDRFEYEFVAGIIGATQSRTDFTLKPKIGWAVVDLTNENPIQPTKCAKAEVDLDRMEEVTLVSDFPIMAAGTASSQEIYREPKAR